MSARAGIKFLGNPIIIMRPKEENSLCRHLTISIFAIVIYLYFRVELEAARHNRTPLTIKVYII